MDLSIDVFDTTGKKTTMTLPAEIFGAKINKTLMAQAVRVYLANQRTGTASTKTRGEVQGSTRKIYRQKGTGRARHGSVRAPIFVHGGVVFGPTPRDFGLSLPKKMKKLALFSALTAQKEAGAVKIVSGLETMKPKTKVMVDVLGKISLDHKKNSILLVLPAQDAEKKGMDIMRASRNIAGITMCSVQQLTTYHVLKTQVLLFTKSAVESMEKQIGGTN